MGTSGSSKGSQSGTPLVPTWLDEPQTTPLPGNPDLNDPDGVPKEPQENPHELETQNPAQPPEPRRFQQARGNFSRFASSGGHDHKSLRRAVRDYVRSGTGGSHNALKRMGSSRAAASNFLGVIRGFQHDGVQGTLSRLNLNNLIGRSPQDIFIGLSDVICKDGGSIDEAIVRDAWLETVAEIDKFGIEDLDALTGDQICEIFLSFIAHAIESRLYQEIGVNGFRVAKDIENIEEIDAQFRSFIERSVRDSFSSDLSELSNLSDSDIRNIVDRTYKETWDLLVYIGDLEG